MKLSQKLFILLIVGLFLFITLASAEGVNSASDEELDLEDEVVPDVENEVPDVEEFENLTPEQQEELLKFQQQQQAQMEQIYSSPDVDSFWYIPPSNERRFQLGKQSEIVLGFENTGSEKFNIIGVRGHIVVPNENFVVQNLTGIRYNLTVQPEEINTLVYNVDADPRLDPQREYGLWVVVYYTNDDNLNFATTFFNETVRFYEESKGFFDIQTVFMFGMIAGILGLAIYFVLNYMQKTSGSRKPSYSGKSKKSAISPSTAETSEEIDLNNLPARFRKRYQNQQSPSSPSGSPKPKNK